MIYIVHGENNVKSRAQISGQQKKLNIQTSTELTLEDLTITELNGYLKSNSLFGDKTLVVIDITTGKGTEEHVKALSEKSDNTVVIIYSEKNIPKTSIFLKSAGDLGAKVVENVKEHNENIFKFIDCLFYKKRKETYAEYEKLISADTDSFYLFTMILYGLRSMAKGFYKSPSFERGSPYTKSKVLGQLKGFSEQGVLELYDKFYTLEKGLKTGEIQPEIVVSMAIENVLNSK